MIQDLKYAHYEKVIDEIMELFYKHGNEDYDGEPVSQASHMIQCAMLAMDEIGNDTDVVVGAFLHDIGHLLKHEQPTEAMGNYGVSNHEFLGADYLRKRDFSEKVCAIVGLHVQAKRYLVATEPGYKKNLSEASLQTLQWQGGPMIEEEIKAFEKTPFFKDAVRVRLYDEGAKDRNAALLPLSFFKTLITKHLKNRNL